MPVQGSNQFVVPEATGSPFDVLRQVDEVGECWSGRRLQAPCGYAKWDRFAEVIEKAKASLALVQGRGSAEHHFPASGSDGGRWGLKAVSCV